MNDRYMDYEALEKIIDYIAILPDEVNHYAANLDADEESDYYCKTVIEKLQLAAEKIRKMAGLDLANSTDMYA